MTRDEKAEVIADVRERVARARGFYVADFRGMTVEDANHLRAEFRKENVDFKVAKNTLIKLALKEIGGYEAAFDSLHGPSGLALSYDDPVVPARVLKKFTEKRDTPKLKIAILEGQAFDGARLAEIAALPSRNEMLAAIIGAIASPASGIVGTINAVMGGLASVIEEVAKKRAA